MRMANPKHNRGCLFLILAAGRSSRMGGQHKGLLPIQGKPLIKHHIENIRSSIAIDKIVIVCSTKNIEAYKNVVGENPLIEFTTNPLSERGMFSSVIEGLSLFDFQRYRCAYIGNVDCSIRLLTISNLMCYYDNIDSSKYNSPISIIPVWNGKKGHPKLINDLTVKKLMSSGTDNRLDHWFRDNTYVYKMQTEDESVTMNINTAEDLNYWKDKYLV